MTSDKSVIAIVDDDALCRRMLEFVLKKGGYDVCSFDSSEAFLSELSPGAYACMVLDLSMPGLSGMDLQCVLNDRGIRTPILFLTAEADPVNAAAALRNGASDMIQKPIDPESLLEKVHEAIESKSKAA